MKSSGWRNAALIFAVGTIITMSGCPGTDVLNNNHGTLSFEVVAVGDTSLYDCVVINLRGVNVLPQDGVCAALTPDAGKPCYTDEDCDRGDCVGDEFFTFFGADGFAISTGLLGPGLGDRGNLIGGPCEPQNPTNLIASDIASQEFRQPIGITLPAGLYRFDKLVVNSAILYIDSIEEQQGEGNEFCSDPCFVKSCLGADQTITEKYEDNDLWFTIQPGQMKLIRFEFDVDAMLERLVGPVFDDCPNFVSHADEIFSIVEAN